MQWSQIIEEDKTMLYCRLCEARNSITEKERKECSERALLGMPAGLSARGGGLPGVGTAVQQLWDNTVSHGMKGTACISKFHYPEAILQSLWFR